MKTRKFTHHIFAVCFLFVLGNAVFALPVNELNPLIFVLLSGGLSLIFMSLTAFLSTHAPKSRALFLILCAATLIISVFGATSVFLDYYKFLTQAQMPHTNSMLVLFILVVTGVILSSFCFSAILKYCLFTGIISIIIIILCFIAGIENYDFSSIKFMRVEKIFSFKVQFLS